jgi:hypothetical protein
MAKVSGFYTEIISEVGKIWAYYVNNETFKIFISIYISIGYSHLGGIVPGHGTGIALILKVPR